MNIQDTTGRGIFGLCGTAAGLLCGVTLAEVSQVLQIIAFAVSIISGVSAALYYIKRLREN